MRKLLPFIAGALLLATLVGLLVAVRVPSTVKKTVPLLSYAHKSTFGYTLHLRPSSLTGAPLPPTAAYPAAVVSKINFTFSYSKPEATAQEVSVKAVLENPGIWKKTLVILPVTGKTGNFQVNFSLDVPQVTGIFKDIEKEVMIESGAARQVTIAVSVAGGGNVFTQSLPVSLTESIIEVSNSLKRSDVSGNGTLNYTVALTNTSLFDTPTLGPPSPVDSAALTLKPGQTALARLVDTMDVTLQYDFTADKALTNVAAAADITAVIEAPGQWSRTFPLLSNVKGGDKLLVGFPLSIADYVQLIEAVNRETGVSTDAYSLTIQAVIHTTADSASGRIDEVYRPSLKGTVKGNVLEWSKELVNTQPGAVNDTRLASNPGRSSAMLFVSLLGCLFLAALIFTVFVYIRYKPGKLSRAAAEAGEIAKKYSQRLAEAAADTPLAGDKVISLSSMADLVRVADELGKPVIHQPAPPPGEGHAYYLVDGATRYQYLLK